MKGTYVFAFALALVLLAAADAADEAKPVELQMKNVHFRLAPDIVLDVRHLRGRLKRTNPAVPVTFDDSKSFWVEVDSGEVAISAASMAALMNSYVLAYEGSPIRNISVAIKNGRVIQKGILHKGVDLPFEVEGTLSATPDGDIRVHAEKIKSAHIPLKGVLHLFGQHLDDLAKQNTARGMKFDGDDIILSPEALTPPPHLHGKVVRVSVAGNSIVQQFGSGRPTAPLRPPLASSAYIYHRGGVLQFGKLTMNDADLQIVGDRPGPFEFFQKEYQKQLVAGYSKNTHANGLVTHMADYSRFRK